MEDLEEAIQTERRAVEVTSPNYPDLASRLNNLGNMLQSRFEQMGRMEDLEDAIEFLRQAGSSTHTHTHTHTHTIYYARRRSRKGS
jgi:Tfp pilus assembly protein PilF